MIEKDDWRLLNDVEYLQGVEINPTDGEEIYEHAPYLTKCQFCWEKVKNSRFQYWFITTDVSCCICDECFQDFKESFGWKLLDGWDIEWPDE